LWSSTLLVTKKLKWEGGKNVRRSLQGGRKHRKVRKKSGPKRVGKEKDKISGEGLYQGKGRGVSGEGQRGGNQELI